VPLEEVEIRLMLFKRMRRPGSEYEGGWEALMEGKAAGRQECISLTIWHSIVNVCILNTHQVSGHRI
jgi:hypothetical protein